MRINIKLCTILFLFISIITVLASDLFAIDDWWLDNNYGNASYQQKGDAVYVTGEYFADLKKNRCNHTGIVYEISGNNINVMDISSLFMPHVNTPSLDDFKEGRERYYGAYCNPTMTPKDREEILEKAEKFYDRRSDIHYTVFNQIDWYWSQILTWNGSIDELDNVRCDGFVEVCYELSNVEVWGKNQEEGHYLIQNYPKDHNNMPDMWSQPEPNVEVAPVVQRGGPGWIYTKLRSAPSPVQGVISKGLQYLRNNQMSNGSWDDSVAITGLAALAFLNNGIKESDTDVSQAIQYICNNVQTDGSITNWYSNYDTSIAILALKATRNNSYLNIISHAKDYLLTIQEDEDQGATPSDWFYGGWGYGFTSAWADLSNTQWTLMALDAAYNALNLSKGPANWIVNATYFLEDCQNSDGGLTYNSIGTFNSGNSYNSMTYAGIWSYCLLGLSHSDTRITGALNWLKSHYSVTENQPFGDFALYYYYVSMAKAFAMLGIDTFIDNNNISHNWFVELSKVLITSQLQDTNDPNAAYWVNSNSSEMEYNANLVTAYALLALETKTLPPNTYNNLSIVLASHCDLHVYDPQGRHIGLNYQSGTIDLEIPGGTFEWIGDTQHVTVPNLIAGKYSIELVGTSTGPYELTIETSQDNNVVTSESYAGNIMPDVVHTSNVTVSAIEGALSVFVDPPKALPSIDTQVKQLVLKFLPGQTQNYNFSITEIGGASGAHGITIHAQDFTDGSGHTLPGNIVSFSPNDFDLSPGGTINIAMTIQWPSDVKYYPFKSKVVIESIDSASRSIELSVQTNPGDLNYDGVVDINDSNIIRGAFGKCAGTPGYLLQADYIYDGCINYNDYREWYKYYKIYLSSIK